jgi:hypothetical protein
MGEAAAGRMTEMGLLGSWGVSGTIKDEDDAFIAANLRRRSSTGVPPSGLSNFGVRGEDVDILESSGKDGCGENCGRENNSWDRSLKNTV